MPVMPPFHDTRVWYHALIGHMYSCWQVRGVVDSIALFQYHAPTIRGKISSKQYNFLCESFRLSVWYKKGKNMPVICCKKKKKYSKYRAFLKLSCDKLRSQLQSDWKRHKHYNQAPGLIQKRDKTQKSVDICKEFMLRTPKPCAPRTRKPQLYEQLFRSCMAFSEVVRVACQSSS